MTGPADPSSDDLTGASDDALLDQLGRALDATDPVPPDAVATAKVVFDLGRADDELAQLVFDSLLDASEVAMRATPAPSDTRRLSFIAHDQTLDIELSSTDGTLLGQLSPPGSPTIELETIGGRQAATTDELGRFRFTVRRGTMRLHVVASEGPEFTTPWINW